MLIQEIVVQDLTVILLMQNYDSYYCSINYAYCN